MCFFFFKQKTAYEMRISDWSSDVCSSDLWRTGLGNSRAVPDIAARACQSFVAGEFGLRFNAGVPLVTSEGFRLGTLCVIDKEMRTISKGQIDDLEDMSSLAMDQMELRMADRQSVVKGKGVSVRVALGGRRII